MSDDNMILRGDAIEAITKCNYRTDVNIAAAINDIPARHPAVKPLVWEESLKGSWIGSPPVKLGHLAFWIFPDGYDKFKRPTKRGWVSYNSLDRAKAAAQFDFASLMASIIIMQPAPDVSALVKTMEQSVRNHRSEIDAFDGNRNGSIGHKIKTMEQAVRNHRNEIAKMQGGDA